MLERDYLTRQLLLFFQAMVRSWQQKEEENPQSAADTLEEAIEEATDLDGTALLSLSPESIAQVLRVSGVDQKVVPYIAHSLLLEAVYLRGTGDAPLADIRRLQASALAHSYGFDLPSDPTDFDAIDPAFADRCDDAHSFDDVDIDDLAALL